jgi:Baculovirus F protein
MRILLIIILSSVLLLETLAHHIIFENIGQLASAVTYIHAKVAVNFTSVEDQALLYTGMLHTINAELHNLPLGHPMRNYTMISAAEEEQFKAIQRIFIDDVTRSQQIMMFHIIRAGWLSNEMAALRLAMPVPTPGDSYFVNDKPATSTPDSTFKDKTTAWVQRTIQDRLYIIGDKYFLRTRNPRFTSLLMGSIGTLFGLYNTHRMNQLSSDLYQVQQAHNQLVEVVDEHSKRLDKLNTTLQTLIGYIWGSKRFSPALLGLHCQTIEQEIYRQAQKVTHAVQAAQNHRLSVDLLSADQLKKLYKKLAGMAKKLNNRLLIDKPSDLFQLEVSYISDGQDIHLLIHVPTVPQEGLLDLFQLHPFPLPLNKNHSLIPVVENNVLALTTDYRKYHTQLSTTALLGCQKVSQVYICERHGVLIKELNQTCVGSLYLQDYEAAQKLCQITVTPTKEIVFQLLGNWFLIFSPTVFTSDVNCANGTRSRFFIPEGISKHHLSAGCQANFKDHVLFSNNAVRLESDILHFEWQWESKFFEQHKPSDLIESLIEFQTTGNTAPTLNDLSHMKVKRQSGFNYLFHIIGFILSTVATGTFTFVLIILAVRYRAKFIKSYDLCCNPCTKTDKTIDPVGSNPEDVPLQAIPEPLPRYAPSYRPTHQLYPPSD